MISLRSAIRGATAGILATIAMSVPMMLARRMQVIDRAPPEEITEHVAAAAKVPLSGDRLRAGTAAAHLGFGAVAGALFATVSRVLPGAAAGGLGPAYGVLIWALSYRGVLPRLRLIRPTGRAGIARDVVMLLAHLVFGVVLGRLAR